MIIRRLARLARVITRQLTLTGAGSCCPGARAAAGRGGSGEQLRGSTLGCLSPDQNLTVVRLRRENIGAKNRKLRYQFDHRMMLSMRLMSLFVSELSPASS